MRRLAVVVLLLAFGAMPVQALYDDMTFTPIITDGEGDAAGFNDIVELALGEPGDETLVVRIQPTAFSPAPPAAAASIDYFVGGLRLVFRPDASHSGGYASCTIDGAYGYCVLPYRALDLAVGGEVPGGYAISYMGTAVDCAPDSTPGTACVITRGTGDTYILQGCTALSCLGGMAPAILYSNVTTAHLNVTQAFSLASNATYQYNWTTNATALQFRALANGTSGNVSIVVVDGSNTTVVNETFSANANRTLDFEGTPGNWTIQVLYDNFTGNLTLTLGAPPEPEPEPSPQEPPTTTSEAEATGGFPLHREEETPGLTLVPLLAVVALAATAVRRRL